MRRLILLTGMSGAACGLAGCGMTVTPEAGLADPVEVYVADHGIHTSLLLPEPDGHLVQFSYSRFDWAALDQDQWYRSIPALLVPGPGTLGTREFPGPATAENVVHQFELAGHHPAMQRLYTVPVSAEKCRRVVAALHARWEEGKDTLVQNQKRGMDFVRDRTSYSIGHNCNTEVAQWLRDLGCRVDGPAVTADVTVKGAPGSPAAAVLTPRNGTSTERKTDGPVLD